MVQAFDADQTASAGPARRRKRAAIRRPRPLHEEVVDRLRDMIVEGDLPVGARLHEVSLAETLNVSRTPLREAVKLLANEGLVDLLPGRGARVAALSAETVAELFEVISGIERQAVELAVARITPREHETLRRMHNKMAAHHAAGERRDYFRLNHEIHVALVAAAKNSTLQATHAALLAKARRGRYEALASQDRWAEVLAEHEALMAAIADRDAERAGNIIRQHVQRTGEVASSMLKTDRRQ
jgi:DNA-binding GntR family transcriptional regulator